VKRAGGPGGVLVATSRGTGRAKKETMAMILADVGFAELFWTVLWLFFLFMFIWVFVALISDLFRDHSLSGWAKAAWIVLLVVFPLIGSLIYVIVRGQGMAERSAKAQQAAKAEFDSYVRQAATGTGNTQVDDLARLADLRSNGHISDAEFETMKQRILGGNAGPAEEPLGGNRGPTGSSPVA
jgi:Short C-terminal domain/Phospholipase_D-nuclease N-terminal